MKDYVSPSYSSNAFTCPFCGVYAQQEWTVLYEPSPLPDPRSGRVTYNVSHGIYSTCLKCREDAFWFKKMMLYPATSTSPMPHPDLPESLKEDYLEARDIVQRSPRGAAALLRVVIDELVTHLGGTGSNVFNRIGSLVAQKKVDPRVQRALDSVRIVANDSVHPGERNVKDNHELANALFGLVNLIVQQAITTDKDIDAFYAQLPESKLQAIDDRDERLKRQPDEP